MLVICNGMKRSGSTLQYNIAASVLRLTGRGQVAGWVSRDELEPDRSEVAEWLAADSMFLIKSHKLMQRSQTLLQSGQLLLLYSFRDIRDVAASAIRTFENVAGLQDVFEIIDEAIEVERQIAGMPGVLMQSYEVLSQSMPLAVREIAAHLRLTLTAAQIEQICRENAMDQVRKQLARKKSIRRLRELIRPVVTRLGLLRPAQFIYRRLFAPEIQRTKESLVRDNHITLNEGRSGTWHEILPPDDARALTSRYDVWLRDHGYAV